MSTATLTDHAAVVSRMYDAFVRGDLHFVLDKLADNCRWIGIGEGSLYQGGTYTGKEAMNFFQRLNETEEINSFNPVSVNNINEQEVVAFGNMTVTARNTGKKVFSEWVMHWKFNDDGKVVYFHDYFDTAAAYIANQK